MSNLAAAQATANYDRVPNTIKGYEQNEKLKQIQRFAESEEKWDDIVSSLSVPDEFVM